MTNEEIASYYKRLYCIFNQIVTTKNQYLIDDYVQEAMIFLLKRHRKDKNASFNSGFLRTLAKKVCIDNIRSNSCNIKYSCTICGRFFNRKEKTLRCCKEAKAEGKGASGFSVEYNEICTDYIDNNPDKFYEKTNSWNPESIFESRDFVERFKELLSDKEKEILSLMLSNRSMRDIIKSVNITMKELKHTIYYFRIIALKEIRRGSEDA